MKKILTGILVYQLLIFPSVVLAEEKVSTAFKDIALPSDFEGVKKEPGAVYYSSSAKGKALIPVNVWGEVNKSGVHFVPVDTTLVQGLSLAGGPKSSGSLDKVKLTRSADGKIEEFKFNLQGGGTPEAYQMKLNPGDTIFIEKEFFYENRAYYTSLFGVIATILSTVLLYRQVKKGN